MVLLIKIIFCSSDVNDMKERNVCKTDFLSDFIIITNYTIYAYYILVVLNRCRRKDVN